MFACLYSLSTPLTALVALAESFTPRFEVTGPLVMLDVSGLSRLLGSFREIGDQLRRASPGPVRIAIAPTQTAAALLALSRAGLTVIDAGGQAAALAPLPVGVLGDLDRLNVVVDRARPPAAREPRPASPVSPPPSIAPPPAPRKDTARPPHVGEMWDALPYFESTLERTSELAVKAHCGGGWSHPRDSHAARLTRQRRGGTAIQGTEHPHAATVRSATATPDAPSAPPTESSRGGIDVAVRSICCRRCGAGGSRRWARWRRCRPATSTSGSAPVASRGSVWRAAKTRARWCRGFPRIRSNRRSRSSGPSKGSNRCRSCSAVCSNRCRPGSSGPIAARPFCTRICAWCRKRCMRGRCSCRRRCAIAKTLRTLVLLDLESNPPSAAVDRVRLLIEPTPARVVQWTLYERAQPSPEQTSTLSRGSRR